MLRVLTSAIPLLETLLLQLSAKESSCELYIAPSLLVGSGLGVYAGKAFRVGDKVLHVPRVAYMNHDLDVSHFQLDNYVFGGYTDGSNILAFGVAMIFNSKKDSHVWFESGDYNEDYLPRLAAFQAISAHTVHPCSDLLFHKYVAPGEEILAYYGSSWFVERGIDESSFPSTWKGRKVTYSLKELAQKGQCNSHVNVRDSPIPNAGRGVFARKNIAKGELIQVSPLLAVARHKVAIVSDELSVLINYVISRPDSDLALLPINYVGFCNHGGNASTAKLEWFFWSEKDKTALEKHPNDLVNEDAASLYLGYRATRDISEDEEITIDYGIKWEKEWENYLQKKKEFRILLDEMPLFRRGIDAPEGLFPAHWLVDCVGDDCGHSYGSDEL